MQIDESNKYNQEYSLKFNKILGYLMIVSSVEEITAY